MIDSTLNDPVAERNLAAYRRASVLGLALMRAWDNSQPRVQGLALAMECLHDLTRDDAITLARAVGDAVRRHKLPESIADAIDDAILDMPDETGLAPCDECAGDGRERLSETRDCGACWGSGERLA